jgi:hypothetical protein
MQRGKAAYALRQHVVACICWGGGTTDPQRAFHFAVFIIGYREDFIGK